MLTHILLSVLFLIIAVMTASLQYLFSIETGASFIAVFTFVSIGYAVLATFDYCDKQGPDK